ncbi:MAG: hypothetical protein EBY66_05090 [Candidatus Fonsibacter lacus]|nr:hypothetical protein [Candidatus Fonsibacter lacus]
MEIADVNGHVEVDLVLRGILRDHVGLRGAGRTFRALELADRTLERGTGKQRVGATATDLLEDRLEHVVEGRLTQGAGAGRVDVAGGRAEGSGHVRTGRVADPLAEGTQLVGGRRSLLLAIIVGADAGFDVALQFAHRLHLGIRNLAGHASNVGSLLEAGNHPLLAELLNVVTDTSAVDGLIGEGEDILTFQHATEGDRGKAIDLPLLIGIGHSLRLGERRDLGSILGSEDGQEVREVFTVARHIVSS